MRRLSCALFVAALAWAPEAKAEVSVDRFEPTKDVALLGLAGIDIATGWVPSGSPIQVSFDLHVEDDVYAELPGDALYDWDTETIHFEGDAGAGLFEVDVGALLDARVRFNLLNNQFESELIGPYDLLAIGETEFTPYLLPGNEDRPAHILHTTERTEVFAQPLVDAIIASGEFVVDASFDIDVALECSAIEVVPEQTTPAAVEQELTTAMIAAPPDGQDQVATARLRCLTRSTVVLLLYPTVTVSIGLEDFELAPFELPIPILTDDESDFDFDALDLLFEAPPPAATGSGGSGGDDSGGDGGSATTGEVPTTDGTGHDTDTDTDADADGSGLLDSPNGCACQSAQRPATTPMMLLMFGFVFARIRRRR